MLPWGPTDIGKAGELTRNSGMLLNTCSIVIPCRLLFVTTTVVSALVVFVATDPKFSVEGVASTAAEAGVAKRIEPIKKIPTNKHTNSVLAMSGRPFAFNLWARPERRGWA
jgi:hypothetical protein